MKKRARVKGISLTTKGLVSAIRADGWQVITSTKLIPVEPGIYIIFSGEEEDICLYVGQSKNLYRRLQKHSQWQRAFSRYPKAYIAYQAVERGHEEVVARELFYAECLMIGLLRPIWNITAPARTLPMHNLSYQTQSDLERFECLRTIWDRDN